jgi:hypothetical protein
MKARVVLPVGISQRRREPLDVQLDKEAFGRSSSTSSSKTVASTCITSTGPTSVRPSSADA